MALAFLDKAFCEEDFTAFVSEAFEDFEHKETRYTDSKLSDNDKTHITEYKYLGEAFLEDNSEIGILILKSATPNIAHKRVGFADVIFKLSKDHRKEIIWVAIYHEDSSIWRLTFVSYDFKGGKQIQNTDSKRYSYELGLDIATKTAKAQIGILLSSEKLTQKILEEVFSVEKLNTQFFAQYKRLFETLNYYLLENNFSQFERDRAQIRAFSKKLLGRITFLYFLQKKGWLGVKEIWGDGNKDFLRTTFQNSDTNQNFYEETLKKIFFEGLSKERPEDNFELLDCKIPFLNGGLFEEKAFDREFLMIDNKLFEDIFQTLSAYNFTIIEDTPHESEVAVDPEMLGKVFENLLEENYKSGKGTFYTPKEIVHYMCKESIYNYLLSQNSTHSKALKALIFKGKLDEKLSKDAIKTQIKAIKILDPAIGSGAFPMGLLSELIHILQILDENLDVVQSKIDIIQNSIYGIDIDPSAVEIAQLRFWLSIVVDSQIPKALPNLDFKIMIGNSLLEKIEGEDPLKSRQGFKSKEKIEELNKLFTDFYTMHQNKNQLREKISKKLDNIFKPLITKYSKQTSIGTSQKETEKIVIEAHKAKNIENILKEIKENGFSNKLFLYKLYFNEIIESGGFNIIIGNPPYLRVQGIDKEESSQYKTTFKSATGSYDLYVLFTEKGLDLLAKDGILNYIMPHKWINSAFGKGLREISKDKLLKFISFGAYQVFNASTYTSLLWFKNTKVESLDYIESNKDLLNNKALENYLFTLKHDDYTHIKNNELTKESWIFTDKKTYEVLQKMKKQPLRVSDVFEKIFTGLQTAKDSVYFIKSCIYKDDFIIGFSEELNREITIEKELVKTLLKGSDVHRYEKLKSDKVVIFPYYIKDKKAILYTENEIKEQFPHGYSYLKECETILRGRERGRFDIDGEWFQLGRKQGMLQEVEKLITPYLALGSQLSYDENGDFYGNTKCFGLTKYLHIKESYKFYLALLNSKLMWFFINNTSAVFSGGYYTYTKNSLSSFPIPKIENIEDTKPFEILVDYVMFAKENDMDFEASHFESVIDGMVYNLYFEEEMKKAECYISDEVRDIVQSWSENTSVEVKKQFLTLTYQAFKASNIIERGLIYSRNIPEIEVINGDKNG